MARYGSLKVPTRTYSRFSCENYKVVRNQREMGGINVVKDLG